MATVCMEISMYLVSRKSPHRLVDMLPRMGLIAQYISAFHVFPLQILMSVPSKGHVCQRLCALIRLDHSPVCVVQGSLGMKPTVKVR